VKSTPDIVSEVGTVKSPHLEAVCELVLGKII
jgi:hypothetical protein